MDEISYKTAGVDIDAGDTASRLMYEASRHTWEYRRGLPGFVEAPVDFFGGLRSVKASNFPDAIVGMNFDGVGTKIEIAERVKNHSTIAYDLFAMVCDDAAVRGAEPILFGSILDCNRLSVDYVRQLAKGMIGAAKLSRICVINGEIAELGDRVQGFDQNAYNWGGAVFWIARQERLLSGNLIREGQTIVALRELGFRSNGLSLVRKVFSKAFGENWHNHLFNDSALGSLVLEPSIIYTRFLVGLTGGYCWEPACHIAGAAHITGGGIPGKLGRLLHGTTFGATLNQLFEPAEIMQLVQREGNISDEEAYRTWNMGQGLLVVTSNPDEVVNQAISSGLQAKIAGTINNEAGIRILSRGVKQPGKFLLFN